MQHKTCKRSFGFCLALAICVGSASDLFAQRSEAILGEPFGVASIVLPLPEATEFSETGAFRLVEANGRAHYAVLAEGRFGDIAGGILDEIGIVQRQVPDLPSRLRISFLFTGHEPLEVTVFTPQPQTFTLVPEPPRRPRIYQRELAQWWKSYNREAQRQLDDGDYPPLIQTYLTAMLAQRLRLPDARVARRQQEAKTQVRETVDLLAGSEVLRLEILQQTMRGRGGLGETADIPLPEEVDWQPLVIPNQTEPGQIEGVPVESIALHVPQECLYVRFGSFENYLWFDHLSDDYGGDIGRMVTLRGSRAHASEQVRDQLALKTSARSEVMGPKVISDVALIGRDIYLKEGAAVGILFEAKNSALLGISFAGDRQAAFNEHKQNGATLENIKIGEHDVSFLSTPDNTLRSFYAVDGDYHLVTTSRSIVERFFAAGAGDGSLGASAEFQHARLAMPLERDDTIFAYFSSAFARGLLSPQYQIELSRRLRSVTDMELTQLARLAATAEGRTHESIEELIAGGFLPPQFGQRGDGGPPLVTDHGFVDPQRGARGTFTPIPDMVIGAITPTEAELYNSSAQFMETQWPQMDPLMVGIKRFALPPERYERVVIDANVSPFSEEKYGWVLSMVGPSTDVEIQSDPTDVITMQMSLKGGLLWPDIPPHHLFLGVQDIDPQAEIVPDGFMKTLQILRSTPGYVGAWPQLGLLDLIPFLSPAPDIFGFSQLPLGLWRWQGNGFSVLSFHHPVLAEASNHLRTVPSTSPAQIRIRVSDLYHSQIAGWLNQLNYSRARQASVGNVRLLNTLIQQLRVAPDQALETANRLLDAELVCTLGGEYELVELPSGIEMWRSTAWPSDGRFFPQEYTAPLLEWFRGAGVDLTKQGDRMFLRAAIDMERKEREPPAEMPKTNLNLFDLFGGGDDAEKE